MVVVGPGPGILTDWQGVLYSHSTWRIWGRGAEMVQGQNDALEGLVYNTDGFEFLLKGDGIQ